MSEALYTDGVEFVELRSEKEWADAFPVLKEFRPALEYSTFLERRKALQDNRYHLLALTCGGKMVSVAGVVIEPHLFRGSELRVNDLVTASIARSKGYGEVLLQHIRKFGIHHSCSRILLYSRNENARAHRFYEEKAGFRRYGVEFSLELSDQVP